MALSLDIIQTWQDWLSDNELERTLSEMRGALAGTVWASELAQQSGRMHSIRKQVRLGTAGFKEQQQVEDTVRKALLDLVDLLREKTASNPDATGIQAVPAPPPTVVNKYFNGKFVSETMNFYGKTKRKKT